MKEIKTNNGKRGGWLVGKRHYDKQGNSLGGIKAIVTDAGGKTVELEGGEVIINREASKKHWKELSRINQSAGNGVAIAPPSDIDEDPSEEYEKGGKIQFNANHLPSKWVLSFAEKIRTKHPEIWKKGGNIFGNEAYENLKRVSKRGYWLDSEEWMYIKWRAYVARHKGDFQLPGVVAMLKWVDKVDKGWKYMKDLIEEEIAEKSDNKMKDGGSVQKNNVSGNIKFMKWFVVWYKQISDTINISFSLPNALQPFKEDNVVILDLFEKIDQNIDAKKYLQQIVNKADEYDVIIYLEPKPRHKYILNDVDKVNKISKEYLISYYEKFGFKLTSDKIFMKRLPKQSNDIRFENGGQTPKQQEKVGKVMGEFKSGKLKSSSGDKVTDRKQAIAIALSEAGLSKYEKGGNVLLAPNGKPSNLTPEQYKLVRTEAFKNWFGDWENDLENSSKVVDENGEPLVVYHGTNYNFNSFSKEKQNTSTGFGDFGAGFYFTSSYNTAKYYTLKSNNDRIILNVFLRVINPFIIDLNWEKISDDSIEKYKKLKGLFDWEKDIIKNGLLYENRPTKKISKDLGDFRFQDILTTNGFDGVFVNRINIFEPSEEIKLQDEIQMLHEIVTFEPNQIKLADGTNTTFDSESDDIRFKKGGMVKTYKEKYNKKYGYDSNESHSLEDISIDTGISIKGLQQIYNKGIGAYKTNPESVRPNVKSKEQWAMARVYSAVMGGDAAKIDANELKMEQGGSIDQKDTVTMDIPLLIRTLELTREDIHSDAELHHVVERLLDLKNKPVLTMDDYEYIADIEHKHIKKMELGGNVEDNDFEKLLSQAHTNLTVKMGRPEYAPNKDELQEEIDKIIMEKQFGSNNI
jgi:hypothetical protein